MPISNNKATLSSEIPELPANAKLKPLHRRPRANAKLPVERIELRLQKHVLAWFREEARHQKLGMEEFINEALRQFIIKRIGEAQQLQTASLNSVQRTEVIALVSQMLTSDKPQVRQSRV